MDELTELDERIEYLAERQSRGEMDASDSVELQALCQDAATARAFVEALADWHEIREGLGMGAQPEKFTRAVLDRWKNRYSQAAFVKVVTSDVLNELELEREAAACLCDPLSTGKETSRLAPFQHARIGSQSIWLAALAACLLAVVTLQVAILGRTESSQVAPVAPVVAKLAPEAHKSPTAEVAVVKKNSPAAAAIEPGTPAPGKPSLAQAASRRAPNTELADVGRSLLLRGKDGSVQIWLMGK